MATGNSTKTAPKADPKQDVTPVSFSPDEWEGQEVEVLDGVELKDKAELVGVRFAITAVKLSVSVREGRQISYAWVEGKYTPNDEPFTFNDSSTTGVREQILGYLAGKKRAGVLDEWFEPEKPILCPNGLRVSPYDVEVPNGRGGVEVKKAKTYYLTTSGRRA